MQGRILQGTVAILRRFGLRVALNLGSPTDECSWVRKFCYSVVTGPDQRPAVSLMLTGGSNNNDQEPTFMPKMSYQVEIAIARQQYWQAVRTYSQDPTDANADRMNAAKRLWSAARECAISRDLPANPPNDMRAKRLRGPVLVGSMAGIERLPPGIRARRR